MCSANRSGLVTCGELLARAELASVHQCWRESGGDRTVNDVLHFDWIEGLTLGNKGYKGCIHTGVSRYDTRVVCLCVAVDASHDHYFVEEGGRMENASDIKVDRTINFK